MLRQVGLVRSVLDDDVPVRGVLCFVDAVWPLLGGAFTTRGVQALWPKKLYSQLQGDGLLTADRVADPLQARRGPAICLEGRRIPSAAPRRTVRGWTRTFVAAVPSARADVVRYLPVARS